MVHAKKVDVTQLREKTVTATVYNKQANFSTLKQ